MSNTLALGSARRRPVLFALITLLTVTELGLTAFLVNVGKDVFESNSRYKALLILFLFNAAWTIISSATYMRWSVDGAVHLFAGVASSLVWLATTAIVWGTATGLVYNARVNESSTVLSCCNHIVPKILGWTEFSLCLLTLSAALAWMRGSWKTRNTLYA